MTRTIPEESLQYINSVCKQLDCALIDFAIRGNEQRLILDLFIDNRHGVSHELCSALGKALRDESANDKFLSGAYLLEVSSPGVDRPLKFNWQYEKHIGRLLNVLLRDGTSVSARLLEVTDSALTLEKIVKKVVDGIELKFELKFEDIELATVTIV